MSEGKILVVDDEPQITRILKRSLTAHRYEVRTAPDADTAIDTFSDFSPNLIITDLQMPEMGGLILCREIRKLSAVPIIVLSVRGEESTKVAALDAGADDYVTKPFGMEELMARIRAALRRQPATDAPAHVIEAGEFRIDLDAHVVTRAGAELHLTPKEFDLLTHLVRNAGKVLTHRALL